MTFRVFGARAFGFGFFVEFCFLDWAAMYASELFEE